MKRKRLRGTRRFPGLLIPSYTVRPSVTTVYCGKTAEAIELPFGLVSRILGWAQEFAYERAHWHHLKNTVKRLCVAAMCGSARRGR